MTALRAVPRRAWHVAFAVAAVGLVVLSARRVGSTLPSFGELRHPDPAWLLVALVAELASLVAYALIVREVLGVWGVAGRLRTLLRATIGGIAMGASLPGGQAVSTTYWYKQLRLEGAGRRLAALVLAGAVLAGAASLGALLVVGVAVAGDSGPLAGARVPILAAAIALLLLLICFRRQLYRLRRFVPPLPDDFAAGRRRIVAVGSFACLNWLLDCAALVAALAAAHASVPAQSVLVTYALAQIVGSLPLLPGGGGTVEVSLSLGFAAFGHTSGNVLAGVLLFRLISCWGLVPVGWLAVASEGARLRALVLPAR